MIGGLTMGRFRYFLQHCHLIFLFLVHVITRHINNTSFLTHPNFLSVMSYQHFQFTMNRVFVRKTLCNLRLRFALHTRFRHKCPEESWCYMEVLPTLVMMWLLGAEWQKGGVVAHDVVAKWWNCLRTELPEAKLLLRITLLWVELWVMGSSLLGTI